MKHEATGEQLEYMRSHIMELIQQDQQVAKPLPDDSSKQRDGLFAQEAKAFMQENMKNYSIGRLHPRHHRCRWL